MTTRIMIVEEKVALAETYDYILHDVYQCETLVINDPQEAVEKFDEFNPDLVTTGINMPGIDGFEFITWLREEKKYTKSILVISSTGGATVGYKEKAFELGATGLIGKPFSLDEFKCAVEQVMEKHEMVLNKKKGCA